MRSNAGILAGSIVFPGFIVIVPRHYYTQGADALLNGACGATV
jgi:hypothetical protein